MSGMERRKFLGLGLTSLAAAMALGSTQAGRVAGLVGGRASAAPRVLELTISDAMVEMVDLNPVYMHPMHAYYRYTTARIYPHLCSNILADFEK